MDKDMIDSLKNLENAEAAHGTWTLPPRNATKAYQPANNTQILNITLAAAKKTVAPPQKSALAVSADVHQKDDPICSSAGCTQYKHPVLETYPMDYPVPNFGVDHEIVHTQDHIAQLEAVHGAW